MIKKRLTSVSVPQAPSFIAQVMTMRLGMAACAQIAIVDFPDQPLGIASSSHLQQLVDLGFHPIVIFL
jgi:hypothetical protein